MDTIDLITVFTSYVGVARGFPLLSGLYPMGTEFLHTVRYIGISQDEGITNRKLSFPQGKKRGYQNHAEPAKKSLNLKTSELKEHIGTAALAVLIGPSVFDSWRPSINGVI